MSEQLVARIDSRGDGIRISISSVSRDADPTAAEKMATTRVLSALASADGFPKIESLSTAGSAQKRV